VTTRGLLDTSYFIAHETGRPIDRDKIPDEGAISVVTLAELHAGVLSAVDLDSRARRMVTLNSVAGAKLIDIDEPVVLVWARMRAHLAQQGRRVNVNDLWIAASAAANDLPVITQDDDFDPLDGIAGLRVIRV
jgi:hypothetical protein